MRQTLLCAVYFYILSSLFSKLFIFFFTFLNSFFYFHNVFFFLVYILFSFPFISIPEDKTWVIYYKKGPSINRTRNCSWIHLVKPRKIVQGFCKIVNENFGPNFNSCLVTFDIY